jgi:opacity protein-like surface antigen
MDGEVSMRSSIHVAAAAFVLILLGPAPAIAQDPAFGIGGRMTMVRGDEDLDTERERFLGGQIRLRLSPRTALEVSLDRRSETNEAETLRVREYPLQASLLLFPIRSVLSPYVLGGGGWYWHKQELLGEEENTELVSTRDFGWHAGIGAELRLGAHAGLHGDYRYTFLDFGSDDEEESFISGLLPSYKGSMWTAGLTFYF